MKIWLKAQEFQPLRDFSYTATRLTLRHVLGSETNYAGMFTARRSVTGSGRLIFGYGIGYENWDQNRTKSATLTRPLSVTF